MLIKKRKTSSGVRKIVEGLIYKSSRFYGEYRITTTFEFPCTAKKFKLLLRFLILISTITVLPGKRQKMPDLCGYPLGERPDGSSCFLLAGYSTVLYISSRIFHLQAATCANTSIRAFPTMFLYSVIGFGLFGFLSKGLNLPIAIRH